MKREATAGMEEVDTREEEAWLEVETPEGQMNEELHYKAI